MDGAHSSRLPHYLKKLDRDPRRTSFRSHLQPFGAGPRARFLKFYSMKISAATVPPVRIRQTLAAEVGLSDLHIWWWLTPRLRLTMQLGNSIRHWSVSSLLRIQCLGDELTMATWLCQLTLRASCLPATVLDSLSECVAERTHLRTSPTHLQNPVTL
jgi:hypothetical protein